MRWSKANRYNCIAFNLFLILTLLIPAMPSYAQGGNGGSSLADFAQENIPYITERANKAFQMEDSIRSQIPSLIEDKRDFARGNSVENVLNILKQDEERTIQEDFPACQPAGLAHTWKEITTEPEVEFKAEGDTCKKIYKFAGTPSGKCIKVITLPIPSCKKFIIEADLVQYRVPVAIYSSSEQQFQSDILADVHVQHQLAEQEKQHPKKAETALESMLFALEALNDGAYFANTNKKKSSTEKKLKLTGALLASTIVASGVSPRNLSSALANSMVSTPELTSHDMASAIARALSTGNSNGKIDLKDVLTKIAQTQGVAPIMSGLKLALGNTAEPMLIVSQLVSSLKTLEPSQAADILQSATVEDGKINFANLSSIISTLSKKAEIPFEIVNTIFSEAFAYADKINESINESVEGLLYDGEGVSSRAVGATIATSLQISYEKGELSIEHLNTFFEDLKQNLASKGISQEEIDALFSEITTENGIDVSKLTTAIDKAIQSATDPSGIDLAKVNELYTSLQELPTPILDEFSGSLTSSEQLVQSLGSMIQQVVQGSIYEPSDVMALIVSATNEGISQGIAQPSQIFAATLNGVFQNVSSIPDALLSAVTGFLSPFENIMPQSVSAMLASILNTAMSTGALTTAQFFSLMEKVKDLLRMKGLFTTSLNNMIDSILSPDGLNIDNLTAILNLTISLDPSTLDLPSLNALLAKISEFPAFISKVIGEVNKTITNIAQLPAKLTSMILSITNNSISALANTLANAANSLVNLGVKIAQLPQRAISAMMSGLLSSVRSVTDAVYAAIQGLLSQTTNLLSETISSIIANTIGEAFKLGTLGLEQIDKFINKIKEILTLKGLPTDIIDKIISAIKSPFDSLNLDALTSAINSAISSIFEPLNVSLSHLNSLLSSLNEFVASSMNALLKPVHDLTSLINSLTSLVNGLTNKIINSISDALSNTISKLLNKALEAIKIEKLFNGLLSALNKFSPAKLGELLTSLIESLGLNPDGDLLSSLLKPLKLLNSKISELLSKLSSLPLDKFNLNKLLEPINSFINKGISKLTSFLDGLISPDGIFNLDGLTSLIEDLITKGTDLLNGINLDKLTSLINDIFSSLSDKADSLFSYLSDLASDLGGSISDALNDILNKISDFLDLDSLLDKLISKLTDLLNKLVPSGDDPIKDFLSDFLNGIREALSIPSLLADLFKGKPKDDGVPGSIAAYTEGSIASSLSLNTLVARLGVEPQYKILEKARELSADMRYQAPSQSRIFARFLKERLNVEVLDEKDFVPHVPILHEFVTDYIQGAQFWFRAGQTKRLDPAMAALFQSNDGVRRCVRNNVATGKSPQLGDLSYPQKDNMGFCVDNVGEAFHYTAYSRPHASDSFAQGFMKAYNLFNKVFPVGETAYSSKRHTAYPEYDAISILDDPKLRAAYPGCTRISEIGRINKTMKEINEKTPKRGNMARAKHWVMFEGCWGFRNEGPSYWTKIIKFSGMREKTPWELRLY